MHSYYSDDGEFTPEELVRKCSSSGIKVMAIADHNSVRANARGKLEAAKAGITYIPAIEIDCTFRGVNLHVLGYGIEYESPDFAEIEDNIAAQGTAASRQMLWATRKMGFQVSANLERLLFQVWKYSRNWQRIILIRTYGPGKCSPKYC